MTDKTTPPAGLNPRIAKALLDKLETDHDFRAQFEQSPDDALRSLGYSDSTECLALKPGAKLASPEQIKAQRAKLDVATVGIQRMECPMDSQAIEKL
ncbi:MAG: NHLP-related RiPP peptide [Thermomonas sp.]